MRNNDNKYRSTISAHRIKTITNKNLQFCDIKQNFTEDLRTSMGEDEGAWNKKIIKLMTEVLFLTLPASVLFNKLTPDMKT